MTNSVAESTKRRKLSDWLSARLLGLAEAGAVLAGHTLRIVRNPENWSNLAAMAGVGFIVVGVSGTLTPEVGKIVLGAFLLAAAWNWSRS